MPTREKRQEFGHLMVRPPTPLPKGPMAVANVFVRLLLRSPLHMLLSDSLLLVTYTGRTSGRRYTIPVTYARDGDVITVITYHAWWKNLRGGAPVVVEIKRVRLAGVAEAIEDDQPAIVAGLLAHLRAHPSVAEGYHIPLDAAGQPAPDAVREVARFVVLVRVHLTPASPEMPAERPRALAGGGGP